MRFKYLENSDLRIEELLEIFPEAIAVLKKDLADLTDFYKFLDETLWESLQLMQKEIQKWKDTSKEYKQVHLDVIRVYFYEDPLTDVSRNIKRIESLVRSREWKRKPESDTTITDSDIAKAKEANLVEIIGQKPDHAGFVCCPFHHEKTPSCKIYDEQRWFCFGACGTGGDTIDFVMKRDGVDFISAVRKIIKK